MPVATKLIAAFALNVAILVGLLIFHVGTIRDTVATGHELSETSSRLYVSSIEQIARIAQLEEAASKYAVTRDLGYLERFDQIAAEFSAAHARLESLPLGEQEGREVAAVSAAWRDFRARNPWTYAARAPQEAVVDSMTALTEPLADLRARAQALGEASQAVMSARLARSAQAAGRAERVSWVAAAGALLLSILVPGVIVRSISRELTRLKAGTRAVAGGDFAYRLPTGTSREFAQVARDFNTMTHRLGELDDMKRDFVSKISHDLKTPLASMRETVNVLLDEVPAPLSPQQRSLLLLNQESGERLAARLAKLLDLSSLQAESAALHTRHELGPIARAAAAAAALASRESGVCVSVQAEDPVLVRCDPERMRQLLDNLLENALKFSPAGGCVELRVRRLDQRPPDVPEDHWAAFESRGEERPMGLLTVTDQGCGVPPDARERVFERFFQTEDGKVARGARGVGLGLTICREIAHGHGGLIWVDEAPGGGSRFSVLLPALAGEPVAVGS